MRFLYFTVSTKQLNVHQPNTNATPNNVAFNMYILFHKEISTIKIVYKTFIILSVHFTIITFYIQDTILSLTAYEMTWVCNKLVFVE